MADPLLETSEKGQQLPTVFTGLTPHQVWVLIEGSDDKAQAVIEAVRQGAPLEGVNMSYLDFDGANLTGAVLTGCLLRGANLTMANLTGSTLENVRMEGANLDRVLLREATLTDCNLTATSIRNGRIKNAVLTRVDFNEATLCGTYIENSTIKDSSFNNADFSVSSIIEVEVTGTTFNYANLTELYAKRLIAQDSSFDHSILTKANFEWSTIKDSSFKESSIKEMSFESATLQNVDFSGSTTQEANFKGAIVGGCTFEYLKHPTNAQLDGFDYQALFPTEEKAAGDTVILYNTEGEVLHSLTQENNSVKKALLDAYANNVKLNTVVLSDVDLGGMELPGLDLWAGKLTNVNFAGSNLTGAKFGLGQLEKVSFEGANLTGVNFIATSLKNVTADKAVLTDAVLFNAVLKDSSFEKCDLKNVRLFQATISGSSFRDASMQGAQLMDARIEKTSFEGANLSESNLHNARIVDTRFILTDLALANFEKTKILNTVLEDSNLYGTKFDKATLAKTSFLGSNPSFTELSGATNLGGDYIPTPDINKKDSQKRESYIKEKGSIGGFPLSQFSKEELTRIIKGGRSDVKTGSVQLAGGEVKEIPRRLEVSHNGTVVVTVRKEEPLNLAEATTMRFSPAQADALGKGRALFIPTEPAGTLGQKTIDRWVQVDSELNRLVITPARNFALPVAMLGKDITEHHQELKETGSAQVDGLKANSGKDFSALLEVDLIRGKLNITPDHSVSKDQSEKISKGPIGETATANTPSIPSVSRDIPEDPEPDKAQKRSGPKR